METKGNILGPGFRYPTRFAMPSFLYPADDPGNSMLDVNECYSVRGWSSEKDELESRAGKIERNSDSVLFSKEKIGGESEKGRGKKLSNRKPDASSRESYTQLYVVADGH